MEDLLIENGCDANFKFSAAVCSMQGREAEHQDTHFINSHDYIFGIFDGHGSGEVSESLARRMCDQPRNVFTTLLDRTMPASENITHLFADIDNAYEDECMESGSTALIVLTANATCEECGVHDDKFQCPHDISAREKADNNVEVMVCNIGDSFCMVVQNDNSVTMITTEHHPHVYEEFIRVYKSEHYIKNNKVDGDLAVTRAFGDFKYKDNTNIEETKQAVITVPQCTNVALLHDDILVLGTAGITEKLDKLDIANIILSMRSQIPHDMGKVCAAICKRAYDLGSTRNLTCMMAYYDHTVHHCCNETVFHTKTRGYIRPRKHKTVFNTSLTAKNIAKKIKIKK